jgi:hypothetical protein
MKLRAVILTLLAVGLAGEARAQWDAPAFMPPRPGEDLGIYLSTMGDFGLQGIWRQHGNLNLGLRLGYIAGGAGGVVAAAESWGGLAAAGPAFPLDVSWTLGAGGVFGDATWVQIPAGLSLGRTLPLDALTVQAYAHPRLALLVQAGGDLEDEIDLDGLVDLGVDLVRDPGLRLRLAATLGSVSALGVGVAIPAGRRAVVR